MIFFAYSRVFSSKPPAATFAKPSSAGAYFSSSSSASWNSFTASLFWCVAMNSSPQRTRSGTSCGYSFIAAWKNAFAPRASPAARAASALMRVSLLSATSLP